jgi:ATP-dependent Lhr-like helicase
VAVLATRNPQPSPFARSLYAQFTQTYLYAWDDPLVQSEVEPTVDQQLLDDILQKRSAGAEGATAEPAPWTEADEATLHRRITAADYPARTAEELLEKIEATGAIGVPIERADDAAWSEWTTTSAAETAAFLTELSLKRRVLSVEWTPGAHRWMAAENLAPLLAARKKRPGLRQWTGSDFVPVAYGDLPAAILESALARHEARRLLVEQALRRVPVTTRDAIVAELSWMGPDVAGILDDLAREGFLHELADRRIAWTEYVEQLRHIALRRQRRAAAAADVSALQRHLLAWQHVAAEGVSVERAVDRLEDVLDQFVGVSLPLSIWELEVLPLRVPTFTPAMLDGVCRSGRRVWVGSRDGSEPGIAFWPRHVLAARPAPVEAATLSESAQKILTFLRNRGASFFLDLQIDLSLDDGELAVAFSELVAAGLVSNDQLEGLREIERLAENARRDGNGHHPRNVRRSASARPRMKTGWWKTRESSATLGGRWFLLPPTLVPGSATELAEAAADRVDRLLRRNAFACRELLEPGVDGPWRTCYDVLTRMEWAGTVRRGYFIEGITGSQFMLPNITLHNSGLGTPDPGVVWLSMLDPANLWARLNTRWLADSGEAARIPRTPGSWIALLDGRPVLAATSYAQRLIPLPAPWSSHETALRALPTLLARLPRPRHAHLEVRQWNNGDIHPSPAADILRQAGFTLTPGGLRLYRTYAAAEII